MTSDIASMLDELMGKHRDVLPEEKPPEPHWQDEEVCKHYLAGFCPNELFTNTKSDLGLCMKEHDPKLKEKYKASSRFGKMGYEDQFELFLKRLHDDMSRKVAKNRARLAQSEEVPPGDLDKKGPLQDKTKLEERMKELQAQIAVHINKVIDIQAEELGAKGKVDEAQLAIIEVEKAQAEHGKAQSELNQIEHFLTAEKQMEVCDICSCFLIVGDAPQRVDEHLSGKQHCGYAKIQAALDELARRREEKAAAERAKRAADREAAESPGKRSKDGKRSRERSRDGSARKDRDRRDERRRSRDRDRDRDRDSRRSDRDRRDKDRGDRKRSRDRRRSRSRSSKRSRNNRSRSRDRRRSRSRERKRSTEGRKRDEARRSSRDKQTDGDDVKGITEDTSPKNTRGFLSAPVVNGNGEIPTNDETSSGPAAPVVRADALEATEPERPETTAVPSEVQAAKTEPNCGVESMAPDCGVGSTEPERSADVETTECNPVEPDKPESETGLKTDPKPEGE